VLVVRESFIDEFKSVVTARFDKLIDVVFVLQSMEDDSGDPGASPRQKPWGTGHALLQAIQVINEPFAVINADDHYGYSSFKLMYEFLTRRVSSKQHAMVGYRLSNTLSDNGSVSRGICALDASGNLANVTEYTDIIARADEIVANDSDRGTTLPANAIASMNFWGFYPSIRDELELRFRQFAVSNHHNPGAEFYIPSFVNHLVQTGRCTVEILPGEDQWFGVTWRQDQPAVRNAFSRMVNQGLYPAPLWGK